MGLLDGLFKRFQPVEQKSANPPLFSYFSPSAMPKMTERQYLEAYKGYVFACTNAIARRMAAVELKLQQHNANGDWIDVPNHDALDLIHRVNDFMSFYDLWFATQAYIELDGNAFWKLNYNSQGGIEEVWMLDPTQMEIIKDPINFIKGYSYTPPYSSDKIPMKVNEVIHFKNFHPRNPWRGMGTVEAAGFPIDIGQYADEWQRNFFGNGTVLSGVLSAKGNLSQDQRDRIKENWNSNYKGSANSNKMALLEGDMSFTPLTPTAREMQFTESKKNIRDEILGIFNVPKPILGILEDINLASAQVAEYNFAKDVIKPKMTKNITTLNEFYLPLVKLDTRKFRFWFKDPVPEDIDQKLSIIASGRGTTGIRPWMTANEARAVFGYEPVEGGDVLEQPTLDATIPDSDKPDDEAHTQQDRDEEDNQEDEEKAINDLVTYLTTNKKHKKVKKKSSPKANDYIQEQITDFKKTYLDLNKKLEDLLIASLKEKSVSPARQKDGEVQNDLVKLLFSNYDDWIALLFNATKNGMQKVLEQSGKDAIVETGIDVSFNLQNERALNYLNQHVLESTNSYSGTMKDDISLAIQEGVEQGSSIDEIKGNIQQFMTDQSDWRAERLARTEVIDAYSQGNLEGYRQSGVVSGVEWLGDDNCCPICQANVDAGVIPLGDGGEDDVTFPSGDDAPPSHPACECAIQPIVSSDGG